MGISQHVDIIYNIHNKNYDITHLWMIKLKSMWNNDHMFENKNMNKLYEKICEHSNYFLSKKN